MFDDLSAVLSAWSSFVVSSLVICVIHWNSCSVYACRMLIFGGGFLVSVTCSRANLLMSFSNWCNRKDVCCVGGRWLFMWVVPNIAVK